MWINREEAREDFLTIEETESKLRGIGLLLAGHTPARRLTPFSLSEGEISVYRFYKKFILDKAGMLVDFLVEVAKKRKRLTTLVRERLNVKKTWKKEEWLKEVVAGVDAGVNGKDLILGYMPIAGAVAAVFQGFKRLDEPIVVVQCEQPLWVDEGEPTLRSSLLGFYLQFTAAYEAVKKWEPSFLLFDGPIVLSPSLIPRKQFSEGYKRLFRKTVYACLKLFFRCERLGTKLIGFVKRCRSARISKILGLNPLMSDLALLGCTLNPGEYTKSLPVDNAGLGFYREIASSIGIEVPEFYSFYINTGFIYRVEIPGSHLKELENLSSLLLTLADPKTGIPFPISEVDMFTRISRPTTDICYLTLYRRVLGLIKDGVLSPEDVNLVFPQFGEKIKLEAPGGAKT